MTISCIKSPSSDDTHGPRSVSIRTLACSRLDSGHMAGASDHVVTAVAAAARRDQPTVTRDGQARPTPIDGVIVERTGMHTDHRGALLPFLDARKSFWSEPVVYAYCFSIRPGRIKGWGMHEHQTDRYFVVRGHVRVALFDGREGSRPAALSTRSTSRLRRPASSASRLASGMPTRTGVPRTL